MRVHLEDIAQKQSLHPGRFGILDAGLHHRHRVLSEIRHLKIAEKAAPVRAGNGAHAPLPGRRQLGQLRH